MGIVTSDMRVVRGFIRKMNRMMQTNTAPSTSERFMLETELSMKLF